MDPTDVTAFGGKPKGLRAHLKMCRGLGQVEPRDIPVLWRTMNRDLVVRPQCRHAFSCPTIAVTGRELVAIEDASNQVIRGDPDQQPDRCDDVLRGSVPLTAPTPWQTQFAMNAAGPMNQQDDLASLSIDVGDDLLDQHANKALLQPWICRRGSPDGLQVAGQRCE
jgi:hypothetical protein